MVKTTIPIEGTTDEPTPKAVLRTVYETGRSHGYDLPAIETYEAGRLETDDRAAGGVTPDFMHDGTQTAKAVWTGVATPFTWSNEVRGAGTTEGSAHMTTGFVRAERTIEETVAHLCETLQIDMAAQAFEGIVADGVNPVEVTFYAVATYAKGWLAERVITATDRFSKGSQSNDEAGQDVYDKDRQAYRQVRPVTNRENDHDDCLYYQWDMRGSLVVGDDFKEVNKAAGEVSGRVVPYTGEITPTLTLRAHSSYTHDGRTYRYLWW